MNVAFLRPAELEFFEAVSYYNEQSEGLGFEFAAEVKNSIGRIVQYPRPGNRFPGEPGVAASIASLTVWFIS